MGFGARFYPPPASGGAGVPAGTIVAHGADAVPDGWLLCDGSGYQVATYPALAAALSASFGGDRGSGWFNVPDLRGRVVVGVGQGPGSQFNMADAAGEEQHTLNMDEIPNHAHTLASGGGCVNASNGGGTGTSGNDASAYVYPDTVAVIYTDPIGGGDSHNNLQPFAAANYIIKT